MGWIVGWNVGWIVGWNVGWIVRWIVGWIVDRVNLSIIGIGSVNLDDLLENCSDQRDEPSCKTECQPTRGRHIDDF